MPVSYSVDQKLRVYEIHAEGTLTESEIFQAYREQMQNSEAESGFDRLIDLREVVTLDVSSQSVRRWSQLLQEVKSHVAPSRIAIAASADAIFGMARMFEIAQGKSPFEVRAFRDLKPARDWLKLTD